MRIGIITHNYPANSQERKDAGIFLYDFAHELAKNNSVFILSPDFQGDKEKYTLVPVTWFKWSGGQNKLGELKVTSPSSLLQFVSLIREGRKATVSFVKKNKIDFLIAAWAFPSGDFAYVAHKKLGTPYATWSLGSDINKYAKFPILGYLINRTLKAATIRFANSNALVKKVQELSKLECKFLPAITNLSVKINKSLSKGRRPFTFLFVGRLESVKGPDLLLEAVAKLSKSSQWQLKLGGDGTLETKLKEYVRNHDLERQVKFLGRLGASEVSQEMLNADCLVAPSRSESLPLVIIEASRAQLPVIATDVGDCAYLINKYGCGYVAKKEDIASLRRQMTKALKTKHFKRKFKHGLEMLADDFKQAKAAKLFLNYVKTEI